MAIKQLSDFEIWQDYGLDEKNRIIMFHYDMAPSYEAHEIGIEHVIRNLLWMDGLAKKPINLWIN